VPQITVSIRKIYGGATLAMPGIGLGGDRYVSWPSLAQGVMGAEGAAAVLFSQELGEIKDEVAKNKQKQKTDRRDVRPDEGAGTAAASGFHRPPGNTAFPDKGF